MFPIEITTYRDCEYILIFKKKYTNEIPFAPSCIIISILCSSFAEGTVVPKCLAPPMFKVSFTAIVFVSQYGYKQGSETPDESVLHYGYGSYDRWSA